MPTTSAIVGAIDAFVLLHVERLRVCRIQYDLMHAAVDAGMLHLAAEKFRGHELRHRRRPLVRGGPGLAVVVGAEEPGHRDSGVDATRLALGEDDGVHAEPAATRPPFRSRRVGVQPGHVLPCLAAVIGAQQRGGHHPGPDPAILIGATGADMPCPLACGQLAAWQPGLALVFRTEDGRRAVPGVRRRPERAAAIADHVADIVSRQRWTRYSPLFTLIIGAEDVDAIF